MGKVAGEGEGAKVVVVDAEGEEVVVDEDHVGGEMSALKHAGLTAGIIASGFTIAYFVDDLQMGRFFRRAAFTKVKVLITSVVGSAVVRGKHGLDDDLVHPSRFVLLEGESPLHSIPFPAPTRPTLRSISVLFDFVYLY